MLPHRKHFKYVNELICLNKDLLHGSLNERIVDDVLVGRQSLADASLGAATRGSRSDGLALAVGPPQTVEDAGHLIENVQTFLLGSRHGRGFAQVSGEE